MGAAHPDEAIWSFVERFAVSFNADRRVHVVAQKQLAGLGVVAETGVDRFFEEAAAKCRIVFRARLHRTLYSAQSALACSMPFF